MTQFALRSLRIAGIQVVHETTDGSDGHQPWSAHCSKESAEWQIAPPVCWLSGGDRQVQEAAIVYCSDMSRADLVRSVLASLPTRTDSVPFPDHPLLLHGPDILASMDGALVAFFVLSRSMRQVIPDVVLSRLALPAETRFVLALSESFSVSEVDISFFDQVIVMADRENAIIPTVPTVQQDGAQLIESVRFFHHERFADAWAYTTGRWHRKRKTPGEPSSLYGEIAGRTSQYIDFHNGEFIFTPPSAASWRSIRPSLYSAATTAVRADYNLERGISGLAEISRLTSSGRAHLALHRGRLPSHAAAGTFDALKPFRAAAFAGFVTRGLEDFD